MLFWRQRGPITVKMWPGILNTLTHFPIKHFSDFYCVPTTYCLCAFRLNIMYTFHRCVNLAHAHSTEASSVHSFINLLSVWKSHNPVKKAQIICSYESTVISHVVVVLQVNTRWEKRTTCACVNVCLRRRCLQDGCCTRALRAPFQKSVLFFFFLLFYFFISLLLFLFSNSQININTNTCSEFDLKVPYNFPAYSEPVNQNKYTT